MTDRILIIDFGSQVTQLIARRVRESGVYSEIHPFNSITDSFLDDYNPKGIILWWSGIRNLGRIPARA